MENPGYSFWVSPLSEEDGGGYLINFPDFNKCYSDGDTIEEAIKNGFDALAGTIAALEHMGLPVPEPGSNGAYSGNFRLRVPKSLHARLAIRAKQEGVSMNTLAVTILAEGLGIRQGRDTGIDKKTS